ncbi:MAG TPA: hypothetical protein PK095_08795 [Myxococcota bacterium]|nr:hypothetical protein [Myxococcota bacterium]
MGLRVMAEYGSSGVWKSRKKKGLFRHGMVELGDLGLSPALTARFAAWITTYEEDNLAGRLDVERFNHEGRALTRELARLIGEAVEFQGELEGGGLGPPELIDPASG